MRLTRGRTVAVAALAGAALALPSTGVLAGLAMFVLPSEPYDRSVPAFDFDLAVECQDPRYAVYEQEGFGNPETETIRDDAGLDVTQGETPTSGTFVVPSLEGGEYYFAIECGPEEESSRFPGAFSFRRLTVDKAVSGEVPQGTTFTVAVDCPAPQGSDFEFEPVQVELDYPEVGGSQDVVIYDASSDMTCTITETEDGGAETVTVDPEEVAFGEGTYNESSTVTNTFAAPEPTPTETETPTPTPTETATGTPSPTPTPTDDAADDDVQDAPPATPVPAQPTYTG